MYISTIGSNKELVFGAGKKGECKQQKTTKVVRVL